MPLRTKPPKRLLQVCDEAATADRRDKVDRVLLCELNYQADELIGLEADNSGSFVVYYDRAAVEKDPHKTTSRPFLSYLRRHRLSRT